MKIGVLGGTFDPVHIGHLRMAESCIRKMGLDKIMFLPNGNPPHKTDKIITDKYHRLNMIRMATEGYEKFFVCDYEINKEDYSYSVETMRHLKEIYGRDLYLIIGADSFYQIDKWYKYKELVSENSIIVLDRSYQGHEGITEDIYTFNKLYNADVHLCNMPLVDISSTDIRDMIYRDEDIKGFVPDRVYDYIKVNKLYKG